MRIAVFAVIIVAMAAAAAPQARHSQPPAARQKLPPQEDQKAIAELQARDIDANMALDVDKLLAIRTDDVVYMVPGRPPIVGQEAVRKYMEDIRRQLANWDMLAYEENWQEVQVVGDFAFQWGTVKVRAKPSAEKTESAAVRNIMQVLRRQPDGEWKIARTIWNVQSPQPAAPPQPAPQTQPKESPKP
jgi:uncharacterized protein (TIGR02246 family)